MRALLVVAGLDPSGGAGLLADVATAAARGLHPAGVATALTLQDSRSCRAVHLVSPSLVADQIALLDEDLPIAAVKIGMLGSADVAASVAAALAPLASRGIPIVLDPVLRASVGADLLVGEPRAALAPLWPLCALVTPNALELERLGGVAALRSAGVRAILAKGGHLPGDLVIDRLLDGAGELALSSPRVPGETPHGTGCALATEIACALAHGEPLRAAVSTGHARTAARIAAARAASRGRRTLPPG